MKHYFIKIISFFSFLVGASFTLEGTPETYHLGYNDTYSIVLPEGLWDIELFDSDFPNSKRRFDTDNWSTKSRVVLAAHKKDKSGLFYYVGLPTQSLPWDTGYGETPSVFQTLVGDRENLGLIEDFAQEYPEYIKKGTCYHPILGKGKWLYKFWYDAFDFRKGFIIPVEHLDDTAYHAFLIISFEEKDSKLFFEQVSKYLTPLK